MNPKDIQTPADVARWLKNHVWWNDEASTDMMLRAVEVLELAHGSPQCTCASIQASDATRHFRECPMRALYPKV